MNTSSTEKNPDFKVVIPARYQSQRLPGKPLRLINGCPMIEHTYRNALKSGASETIVATDDERITRCVEKFGGEYCITSSEHRCGSDRINEVAEKEGWGDDVIIINVQSDEPFLNPKEIAMLATVLVADPEASIATLASAHPTDAEGYHDRNRVKVICDAGGYALSFSRTPIADGATQWLCHHGIYAYRRHYLRCFALTNQSDIEKSENLEQLRAMVSGDKIRVQLIAAPACFGIDSEADLVCADHLIKAGE